MSCASNANFNFENKKEYTYYRLTITANNGNTSYASLAELDFGTTKIIGDRVLNEYRYILPVLKSGAQAGYVAGAGSNAVDAYKAFGRSVSNSSDCWLSENTTDIDKKCTGVWVNVQLPTAAVCNCITLHPRKDYGDCRFKTPRSFSFEGSSDGTTWTLLLSVEDAAGGNGLRSWNSVGIFFMSGSCDCDDHGC